MKTILTNKSEKSIPEIRFPEFVGIWEECKLGELTKRISEKNKENAKLSVYSISNVHGFIPQSQQFEGLDSSDRGYDISMYKIIHPNTFAYNPARINVGSIGYSKNLDNIIISSLYVCFSTKAAIDDLYLLLYLKSFRFVKDVIRNVEGGVRDYLFYDNFANIKVRIPSVVEQKRIASFLTVVNEKTQQLRRKKELLEQYKKGAMQQLFTGKLRFKDENGEDYADWEEKRLGELTYKVGKKNKENIKYPIYSINNKEGFLPQSEQFDGLDSNDRGYDISLYKIVNSETFAYNPARINVGSIGYSYNLNEVIISSLYVCFKTKDQLEDLYLLAYLDTYNFKKEILIFEEGGVRQYLFYENFSMISIPLPSNKEQKRIANFLSIIDAKIESVNQQITQTQSFKKGLLQQMFV